MTDPYRPKPRTGPRRARPSRVEAMWARLARLGATPEMIAEAKESFEDEDEKVRAEIVAAFAGAPDSMLREQINQHLAAEEAKAVEFKAYASAGAVTTEPEPEAPAPKPAKKKAAAKKAPAKARG